MIIEDGNGNDIDLNDDRDQDREPPEPESEPPLSLEQIEAALAAYQRSLAPPSLDEPQWDSTGEQAASLLLDEALPQLIAALRAARIELAEWRAIPVTVEYMLTEGAAPAAGVHVVPVTREQADAAWWDHATGRSPSVPWAKATYVTGWRKHEAPPF